MMKGYFSKGEWLLWSGSVALVLLSYWVFAGSSLLTLLASLIGVTSLIFNAKGNPFGQLLIVYGYVSWQRMHKRQTAQEKRRPG